MAVLLEYKLGAARARRALARILDAPALRRLASRPQRLQLLADVLEDPDDTLERATLGSLYTRYASAWIHAGTPRFLLSADQRTRAVEQLAAELWKRGHGELAGCPLISLLRDRLLSNASPDQLDLELREAPFLIRSPDARYRFAHRGFLEYFFACHLARCVSSDGETLRDALATEPLTPPCMALLIELIADVPEVLDTVQAVATGAYTARASDNALWITAALRAGPGAEQRDVAASLTELAAHFQAQGAYTQATSLYQRTLNLREQTLPGQHPDLAASLDHLAAVYTVQGAHARAEPLYQRALHIREQALGSEHPDLVPSLDNLAGVYLSQAVYPEAETLYLQALRIREQALGPYHPDVAASLDNLGGLYRVQGRYPQAESLYQRALRVREQAFSSKHPDVATSLHNLGEVCQARGAYAQAAALYQRALHIREQALGADHPDVAATLNKLRICAASAGITPQ